MGYVHFVVMLGYFFMPLPAQGAIRHRPAEPVREQIREHLWSQGLGSEYDPHGELRAWHQVERILQSHPQLERVLPEELEFALDY